MTTLIEKIEERMNRHRGRWIEKTQRYAFSEPYEAYADVLTLINETREKLKKEIMDSRCSIDKIHLISAKNRIDEIIGKPSSEAGKKSETTNKRTLRGRV